MWQPSKLTPEQLEERRMEGGRILREGNLSHAEIARRLGVSRSAVSQWARQIKQRRGGLQSLKSIMHKERQSYLTDSQWQKVLRDLQRGSQALGYEYERWTLSRIQRLIAELPQSSLSGFKLISVIKKSSRDARGQRADFPHL